MRIPDPLQNTTLTRASFPNNRRSISIHPTPNVKKIPVLHMPCFVRCRLCGPVEIIAKVKVLKELLSTALPQNFYLSPKALLRGHTSTFGERFHSGTRTRMSQYQEFCYTYFPTYNDNMAVFHLTLECNCFAPWEVPCKMPPYPKGNGASSPC